LFGLLSVFLRAATLSFAAIALGGVAFGLLVLRRSTPVAAAVRLQTWSAFALAVTQVVYVASNSAVLLGTTELDLKAVAGAGYFIWGCVCALAALALGIASVFRSTRPGAFHAVCVALILASTVATSHAASRLDHQGVLLAATAIHQLATGAWIGGLPYLLLTLRRCDEPAQASAVARHFSHLAIISVILLFGAGVTLSLFYVGSLRVLYGTTYGVMLAAKALLFGLVLSLGALNFGLIRNQGRESRWLIRLKRISEAEIGIGMTAVLAAASLTSQPPAVDVAKDRVPLDAIVERYSPRPPRLATPPLSTLSPSTRELWNKTHKPGAPGYEPYAAGQIPYIPPTQGDIAWSEYNHHWAGLVVLVMGMLAVLSSFQRFAWARHWPIAFVGLAVFLLLRADPENWPLGPSGFWESFTATDVFQHRMFILLILVFAAFEWGVQTHRLKTPVAALVFPSVCAAGGALLLTHTHGVNNLKEELLAELSHTPIALLAVAAGWSRWLELRLSAPVSATARRIWPVCFTLIGVMLLLYREG
jgi:putative copper resistance protein D